ncbi:hypothetical protein RFI_25694 [Reticulomyxa filosa]|uniref:Uncharacterized protein n=1 Tax=Reticulomyxa filosa TaxID=46433 RepID=X6ME21_RETFI|nr:hypothetical protein RFI_25694 [Reticulomyxa filosa]|eukprot:ETO11682.1 hypothetical protein RFI_25694 [Reticulomyxa filosa]
MNQMILKNVFNAAQRQQKITGIFLRFCLTYYFVLKEFVFEKKLQQITSKNEKKTFCLIDKKKKIHDVTLEQKTNKKK